MKPKTVGTVVLWALAIVVPGGLALLALWLSVRAARAKANELAPSHRVSVVPVIARASFP